MPITPIQNTVATSYNQSAHVFKLAIRSTYGISGITAPFESLNPNLAADAALGRDSASVAWCILSSGLMKKWDGLARAQVHQPSDCQRVYYMQERQHGMQYLYTRMEMVDNKKT